MKNYKSLLPPLNIIQPLQSSVDLMPGIPPLNPSTPFNVAVESEINCRATQKKCHPLSNPYRLALIDYFYTYRDNIEYIPERFDVAYVKTCLLKYVARYIPKWEGYDVNKYSIT